MSSLSYGTVRGCCLCDANRGSLLFTLRRKGLDLQAELHKLQYFGIGFDGFGADDVSQLRQKERLQGLHYRHDFSRVSFFSVVLICQLRPWTG